MKAMATNQNISWFNKRWDEDNLDLDADFQRNPVWQQAEKDYLLETILLELPIPEIYYVSKITKEGETEYVIVDGQQRLRTIIEFIKGDLSIYHLISEHPHVKNFSDLTEDERNRFWRYPIVVRDLEDSTDEEVRDLFQRLNKYSIVLNDQELRNARFKGYFLKTVQNISEHDFWPTSGLFSSNDIRRMLDLEFISIVLCTLIGGIFNRKDRVGEFYNMYEEEFEESQKYKDEFNKTLEIIDLICPDMKKRRWRNKGDFMTLFLCINELDIDTKHFESIITGLGAFESHVRDAKLSPEVVEEKYISYLDAATYGTNDKEKRIRRYKILSEELRTLISD